MKRSPKACTFVLPLLVALAGCGGHSIERSTAATNPFQGAYTGTYGPSFSGDTGTLDLAVASNGSISGSVHSNGLNLDGTVAGTLSRTAGFDGTLTFSNGLTATLSGALTSATNGALSGTLTETVSGQTGDVPVALTRVND